jgi:aminopeptidase-like protein
MKPSDTGQKIYALLSELFPINRSLTGQGVRDTLTRLQDFIPLDIHSVESGTTAFDWTTPPEWNIREAWVKNAEGEKIIDFQVSNLHVMGYSTPVDKTMQFSELRGHLHSLPEQPDAIPYITSYYKERWGFCLSHEQLLSLPEGEYHVYIDSDLSEGILNYADLVIPGESSEEIMFSTYICHPSMANNELSGPCLATYLAKWLMETPRKYTYRFVFVPETIGAVVYLSKQLEQLQKNVKAGYVLTCCGDDRCYSFVESRQGNTLADRAARSVLNHLHPDHLIYSFLQRGSDERQYCAPGIDLPIASVMRSKYGEYPEYHTSLDNLELVSPAGLQGAFDVYTSIIELLEFNDYYKVNCLCEPQLGKRGLYPDLSTKGSAQAVRTLSNLIAYSDGERDLIQIAEKINVPAAQLYDTITKLINADLLTTTATVNR